MDRQFVEEMQHALLTEQGQLRKQLGSFAAEEDATPAADDYRVRFPSLGDHQDENAQEVQNYSDNLSLERNLEASLAEVDKALGKITHGAYGVCENCGQEISKDRLRAFPAATLCTTCASQKAR